MLVEDLLALRPGHVALQALAVREEQRRRRGDAELLGEVAHLRERVLAGAGVARHLVAQHHVVPRADLVVGAQRLLRLGLGVGREDRDRVRVDRHVLERDDVGAHALAVAAVRVLEDRNHALAVADDLLEREVQRQVLEVDRHQLVDALAGEVAPALEVDHVAFDERVLALVVDVDQVVAEAHLPHARHRRLAHLVDLEAALQPRLHRGLDSVSPGGRDAALGGQRAGGERHQRRSGQADQSRGESSCVHRNFSVMRRRGRSVVASATGNLPPAASRARARRRAGERAPAARVRGRDRTAAEGRRW